MRGSKVRGNNLGEGLGCRGDVQRLPGRCARVAGEMCKGAKVKSTPSPKQLSLNKFFDPSTPSMRKGRNGEKKKQGWGKNGEKRREKMDQNSGHYVIASSPPPERRPLECRTLAPIHFVFEIGKKG